MGRQTLISLLVNLIFPPRCVGCQGRGAWICHACQSGLPRLPPEHCPICARPRDVAAVCDLCLRQPPEFDRLLCAFLFEGTMRQAIHRLKYRGARHLAEPLAHLLLDELGRVPRPDLVVPVPLHPARYASRGYNQSALLADVIGRALAVTVREDGLRRIRDTPAQVSLSGPARWLNVRGAFEATASDLRGRSVLLIDDVATTGSTLRAASLALKSAGAGRVDAMVLARVP